MKKLVKRMKIPREKNGKMGNNFAVVGFYTQHTPYEQVMNDYLFPSIKKHNLMWIIFGKPSLNNWTKNTGMKPSILLECFKNNQHFDSFVMLDADATIEQYPQLFHDIPAEYDIGVHYLDRDAWYGRENSKKELLSGTIFIRRNDRTKALLLEWEAAVQSNEFVWEQKVLEFLLEKHPEIKVFHLPIEYCYIASLPSGEAPRVQCNAVIKHHQVSRTLKKFINSSLEKK